MGGVKIPITSTKAAFLSAEAQILHATAGWGHISPQTDGHWCLQLNSFEQRLSHGSRMHGLPHGKGQAPWGHFHTHDSAHEGQGSWHFRPQLIILIYYLHNPHIPWMHTRYWTELFAGRALRSSMAHTPTNMTAKERTLALRCALSCMLSFGHWSKTALNMRK